MKCQPRALEIPTSQTLSSVSRLMLSTYFCAIILVFCQKALYNLPQNWHELAQVNGSQHGKLPIQNILNYIRYGPKHLKFPNFF